MLKRNIIIVTAMLLFTSICSGENSSLVGKLYVVGNVPFTKLVCETDSKEKYVLEGSLLDELSNLQGATVKVEGNLTGKTSDYGMPLFKVEKYQLLFVGNEGNQKEPLIGFIRVRRNSLYLELSSEKSYLLKGPLTRKIIHFEGAKVWMLGEVKPPTWTFGKTILIPEAFHVIKKIDQENNRDDKIGKVN